MNIFHTLLFADIRQAKSWFANHLLSKLVVIASFIGLYVGISWGLMRGAGSFFSFISQYEAFGYEAAVYIIHAAIVLIVWLSFGSFFMLFSGMFLAPGSASLYLNTLPVRSGSVFLYQMSKTMLGNIVLFSGIVIPVLWQYGVVFHAVTPLYSFHIFLLILSLMCFCAAVALPLARVVAPFVCGKEYKTAIMTLLLFFSGMLAIMKTIFPPQMGELFDASPAAYRILFDSLPLNSHVLPTYWISRLLSADPVPHAYFVVSIAAVIFLFSVLLVKDTYFSVLSAIRSRGRTGRISQATAESLLRVSRPLMLKDILMVLRNPAESGYGLFLFSVAVFFFVFLRIGMTHIARYGVFRAEIAMFAFSWIIFFAVAALLRFVFPAVSMEAVNARSLFTQPVSWKTLYRSKKVYSLLYSVILIALSWILLAVMPFEISNISLLLFLSGIMLLLLPVIMIQIGSISPKLDAAASPEVLSTNAMGMSALGVTVAMTVLALFVIKNSWDSDQVTMVRFGLGLLLVLGAVTACLELLVYRSMNRWKI